MSDQNHVKRNVGRNRVHEKPKNFKKAITKLLTYDKKLTKFYIIAMICAVLGSFLAIISPNALSALTDTISDGILKGIDFNRIKQIGIFLAIIIPVSALLTFTTSFIMATTANKLAKKLRTNISKKINKLPLHYYDKHSFGDVLSRVTNDVDTIGVSISQSLGVFASSTSLLICALVMMFTTNWMMAVAAILSSMVGFFIMMTILPRSQKYFNAKQEDLGNLNGHIEEMYSGYNVVKVNNGKKQAIDTFNDLNDKLATCGRRSQFLSGLGQPIMNFTGNFSYLVVCIVGAILVKQHMISFGVIVAFMVYVRQFTGPLVQISQGLTNLQTAAAAGERVLEFLDEKEMADESDKTKVIKKEDLKGNIEFDHVKFAYDEGERTIIKDFSAKANAGQKIAIVGPTGAGKTTLVSLLMKFYEINSGDIKIEGTSIKDLTRENIHDLFVMVLQDTWLFKGTIRENIVYNKKGVTDEEVMNAIRTVGLEHFVKGLPKGLDTELNDTDSISAGQKQLLTIARAMIENAPFLILDEATSNVDTRTEELVQKAMDKLTEGRTSFIIAHRLSTIKNADLILVINDGDIIEQGTHEELLKLNGFYAELYNSQFQKAEDIA